MTDAIVTDITVYRQSKGRPFENWLDKRVESRYNLLVQIEKNGFEVFGDPDNSIVKLAFPEGFDPEARAEDNLATLRAELERRGLMTKSP